VNRPPKEMTPANMAAATADARYRIETLLKEARDIETDARAAARLSSQECRSCFYRFRLANAAGTTQPCMCCGSKELYGSSATRALCQSCARTGGLCSRCGGDMEMDTGRRVWPEPQVAPKAPAS
jgi:hypothetical protein